MSGPICLWEVHLLGAKPRACRRRYGESKARPWTESNAAYAALSWFSLKRFDVVSLVLQLE